MLKKLLLALMLVCLTTAVATARDMEGVTMPETLEVGNETLVLNGLGLRNIMILKVYVAGLYLRAAETDAQKVIMADEPMAMRLHMVGNANPKTMSTALKNGMRNSLNDNNKYLAIKDRMAILESFYPKDVDIKKGSVFEFKYLPNKGLLAYKDGSQMGVIPGLDFKQAFFGIWLGPKPPQEDLKAGLMAGKVSPDALAAIAQAGKAAAEAKAKAAADKAAADAAAAAAAAKKAEDDAKLAAAIAAAQAQSGAKTAGKAAAGAVAAAATATGAGDAASAQAKQIADTVKPYASPDEFSADVVYFDSGSTVLNKAAKRNLTRKVQFLKSNFSASAVIEPVVDTKGNPESNRRLSAKRGDAVRAFLLQSGISASRVELSQPKPASGGNYLHNRRVEVRIK